MKSADQVVVNTTMGALTVVLYAKEAPATVANFLQYAGDGYFDGTIFHRVTEGFMIQGGGFTPDMRQKSTRPPIRNEASNGLKNARGALAMARTSAPGSATSQFFINVVDNVGLDYHLSPTGMATQYSAAWRK